MCAGRTVEGGGYRTSPPGDDDMEDRPSTAAFGYPLHRPPPPNFIPLPSAGVGGRGGGPGSGASLHPVARGRHRGEGAHIRGLPRLGSSGSGEGGEPAAHIPSGAWDTGVPLYADVIASVAAVGLKKSVAMVICGSAWARAASTSSTRIEPRSVAQ